MAKKIIFIAGASHSGSTLLGCILGSHKHCPYTFFHVGEIHAFFTRNHTKYGQLHRVLNLGCREWKTVDCLVDEQNAYNEIFSKFGTNILIDSSKNLKWLERQYHISLQNEWEFQIVVSYRPLHNLWQSGVKRNYSFDKNYANLCYYGKFFEMAMNNNFDYKIVNTPSLIKNSAQYTELLCKHVNIPFFYSKEKYWKFKHCHLYGSATQSKHILHPEDAKYHYNRSDISTNWKSLPLNQNEILNLQRYESLLMKNILI